MHQCYMFQCFYVQLPLLLCVQVLPPLPLLLPVLLLLLLLLLLLAFNAAVVACAGTRT